ncbi:Plant PDR ABC transporter associated [Dillenia turbinata]|uniref:Plant PDR ABC transporter associated n=1 Tax=Dillenia turbinata TaxID=194707 RepID=A0AAN8UMV4_9MAGN
MEGEEGIERIDSLPANWKLSKFLVMAQLVGADEIESFRIELAEIGRSLRSSFQRHASSFRSSSAISSTKDDFNDENKLQWAAIERLPTSERLRSSLFDEYDDESKPDAKGKRVIDVTALGALERHMFIEKLIKHIQHDNLRLLQKIRRRIDRVGVKLPTVEVRYKNLCVEAKCTGLVSLSGSKSREARITVINNACGIIKPGRLDKSLAFLLFTVRRLTLLLGPPGSGKTTFLLALSGNLKHSLKIMLEVSGREKQAGVIPDLDIDTYMKAISVEGLESTLQTDYILKTIVASSSAGSFVILFVMLFGGFIIPQRKARHDTYYHRLISLRASMPNWLKWAFWVSPLTYGEIGLAVNEFRAPRWQKYYSNSTVGEETLKSRGLNFDSYYFWISIAALFAMTMVFNIGFTLALTFLKPPGFSRGIISHEKLSQFQRGEDASDTSDVKEKIRNPYPKTITAQNNAKFMVALSHLTGMMVLPFEPLTVTFQDVQYYIDTPVQIPRWWVWLYYLIPTSWTLNGMLTSQYGDIDRNIVIFGETKTMAAFLKDYFGFHHDRLALVGVMLIVFPLAFALLFSYCIGKLNFQRR